jgi:hypothetical protein
MSSDNSDFLIPRRLHSALEELIPPQAAGQSNCLPVDPEAIARRRDRKLRIPAAPSAASEAELLRSIDQRMASVPAYDKPRWTIGEVVCWVIERTPRAVNGLSVDEERLQELLGEIQEAFARGEVEASGNTRHDPIARRLSPETFEIHPLTVEARNGLLRVFPLAPGAESDEQAIFNVLVDRSRVLQRWPAGSEEKTPHPVSTAAAERRAEAWLVEKMRTHTGPPPAKQPIRAEAVTRFKVSVRGFDRAWSAAVQKAGRPDWSKAGRRT